MRFRNAVRLLADNFSCVFKLLLFRLVTGGLFLGLTYVIVSLTLNYIITSAEAQRIVDLLKEFFQAIISGQVGFLETFHDNFTTAIANFLALLGSEIGTIVGSLIGVIALYLVQRFLNGTAIIAMGSILHDKMEFYSRTKFSAAYFKNLAKSALYQIIYVPVTFVYDLLSLTLCWFFFFYTPSFLPSWGIFTILIGLSLSLGAYLCLQAVKMTFFSAWIPAIIDGEKIGRSLKESLLPRHGFAGRFGSFLIAVYLVVVVNVVCGIVTFGSMLFITIPASYLFLLTLQFVHYFEDRNRKYFLSFRKISGVEGKPESMGD